MQHLGLRLNRNNVSIGRKTQSKNTVIIKRLQVAKDAGQKKSLLNSKKGYKNYKG